MHEYSLMQRVMETVLEKLKNQETCSGKAVEEVVLKVGALDVHSASAAKQAYEMLAKGTALEKSRLTLVIVAPTLKCAECGYIGECSDNRREERDPIPYAECPSCGAVSETLGGRGVESIELIWER